MTQYNTVETSQASSPTEIINIRSFIKMLLFIFQESIDP